MCLSQVGNMNIVSYASTILCLFAKEQIDTALKVAGASATDPNVLQGLAAEGINYVGYAALASGTILIAMLMAAIVAFVIDRNMLKTAIASFMGAAC